MRLYYLTEQMEGGSGRVVGSITDEQARNVDGIEDRVDRGKTLSALGISASTDCWYLQGSQMALIGLAQSRLDTRGDAYPQRVARNILDYLEE